MNKTLKAIITLSFFVNVYIVQAQLVLRLNAPLKTIQFLDQNNGFAIGNNGGLSTFYKTTNGGLAWTNSATLMNVEEIQFLNNNIGYATGQSFVSGFTPGVIKTTDGGATWTGFYPPVTNDDRFDALFFTSENTGFIAGQTGRIYKTTNGGVNWTLVASGFGGDLTDIFFVNDNIGFIVGGNGKILKTTDGGNNWVLKASGTNLYLKSVAFMTSSIGFAVGNGVILKTVDGGETWSINTSFSPTFLTDINIVGNKIFVSGNENTLLNSTNQGATWGSETLTGPTNIEKISFITENKGFIAGSAGYEYNSVITSVPNLNTDNSITIYPNPVTNGILTIKSNGSSLKGSITITNLSGIRLIEKAVNTSFNQEKVNVTTLPSGLYFIYGIINEKRFVAKFIKQ